jgi:flagellar biogenesis protein FliO
MADIVMLGILAVLLLFVFFVYLMVRRTITGFKKGVEDGQRDR